jgi:iron complex outermembrane receptor protein
MNGNDSLWNRVSFLAISCALTIVFSVDARAQTSPAASGALEEITVTAKRRTEDIQTTSISATVLTADLVEAKGVTDLFSVQYAAPALTVTQYGSANVLNIRGLGRSQVDIDVPSGVVIYRDGAPTLAGYFQNEPYFDIESIDVFRGPQGTFVGKNAAGGAIFINTRDPELGDFNASVEGGIGNYSAWEATMIANIPAGDTAAVRMDYRHYERDDFYDSITGNFTGHPGQVDNNSYRLGFLWKPNDSFSGVLKVDYHDLDFGGNPTSVYQEKPLGDLVQNANFQYTDESLRTVLDLKYQFTNGISLTSLTGYQDVDSVNNLDVNATLPLFYVFNSKINAKIYSEEINLISPNDQRFTWVVGLFWEKQDSELPPWQDGGFNFIGNGFAPDFPWATSPWQNDEEDRAVFVHTGFRFTQQVQLEAGVRYSEYERDQFTLWQLGDGATPPSIPWPGTNPTGERQNLDEDSVDWQVALNWDVNANQYAYGVISRGHVTGGINIFPPFVEYDEMEVINYELGWKSRWANDQFNTQFTVYYEEFKDYQANFAEVVGALNFPTNRNAETDSHLWGIELSGQARFGAFHLDFGVAYSDSELGTFSDVQDPFLPPPNNIVNLSGNEIPFAPNFTGNIGMAYDIKLGNLTLTPRVDYSHIDATQAALWDTPMETLPERDLVNAQISLEPDSGKWSAVLWSTNLTDEEYIAGIQNNATLYYAAPPGQYGLRFKYNF